MTRPELISRWSTPDGRRRRERLVEFGLRGPWQEALRGFSGGSGDERADLRGIDLSGLRLPGAELTRVRLEGARLEGCHLVEARLDLADLSGASLARACLDRASLLACVALETRWDDASLEGAVLTAANLARGSFRRARLREARLTVASLMRADLRVADLRGADLYGCDMEDALIACVRRDRPRTYTDAALARHARQAGFPNFLDALLLFPGASSLRRLHRGDALLHVEAGLEASPQPQAELSALLEEPLWPFHLVAAAALVLGGVSPLTLAAAWKRLDLGSPVRPQLTVALRLVDVEFEQKMRARDMPRDSEAVSTSQRWLQRLRLHVPPRLQERWRPLD
jgi:hypothetical protein